MILHFVIIRVQYLIICGAVLDIKAHRNTVRSLSAMDSIVFFLLCLATVSFAWVFPHEKCGPHAEYLTCGTCDRLVRIRFLFLKIVNLARRLLLRQAFCLPQRRVHHPHRLSPVQEERHGSCSEASKVRPSCHLFGNRNL
ncbi:hypothetical protein L596_020673 [Steinernema carpocapsae]|uniref:Uncharacterized protein n=1 Tax=Steinernema carpocapsae TaxID=34508 RepID=A0A4U5MU88_STECR|nr:hypothetical protein L596_020673 [Steinernema carpocapsae]